MFRNVRLSGILTEEELWDYSRHLPFYAVDARDLSSEKVLTIPDNAQKRR